MSEDHSITRRQFFGATVVAGAAGSLAACSEKAAKRIIPYVVAPDDVVPGESRWFRTVCRECPAGCGLEVRTREGRAVKIEGNPLHPVNRGKVCIRGQAAIEDLYAPERLGAPLARAAGGDLRKTTWDAAEAALGNALRAAKAGGKRVAVLTRPERGAMGAVIGSWLEALGQGKDQVVTLDGGDPAGLDAAVRQVFDASDRPWLDASGANMLLAIGYDLVDEGGSPVEQARGIAEMRARTRNGSGRFVYVGPRMSLTAAAADEWLAPRPGSEVHLVLGLAEAMLQGGAAGVAAVPGPTLARLRAALEPFGVHAVARATGLPAAALGRLADGFLRLRPSLAVGPGQAVLGRNAMTLASAVHLLNFLAGNVGQTVRFLEGAEPAALAWTLRDLMERMEAGEVGLLCVHHANPLGAHPARDRFRRALDTVASVAVFGNRLDETARRAHLVLPDHHFLEAWGDVVPRPGVRGIQQPVMVPLHATRAAADVLLAAARHAGAADGLPEGNFEAAVRHGLTGGDIERGGIFGPAGTRAVALRDDPLGGLVLDEGSAAGPAGALSLVVFPCHGGAHGGATLLQEIPDPIATVSWSGWVEIHPRTAARLGVAQGDVLALDGPRGRTELPACVYPGLREDVVAVPAGYAADLGGGDGAGPQERVRVRLTRTQRRVKLPLAAGSASQHERELARTVPAARPVLDSEHRVHLAMYPLHDHASRRWGMVVDLDRCLGCAACVAACYVENNIPVVGAAEVTLGREMAWLRIDRFLEEGPAGLRAAFLPLMCQQCCNAPCETVCPVYATYHRGDGLNAQIYNRCVGTRYCANNCPYAARRFNFWDHPHPEPTALGLNPDVTVRERGVMEKCTFCFQRIREAEEQAKMEKRSLRASEVVPACAQTCPADAIVFGDLNDKSSPVARLAGSRRSYRLLEQLNTEPGLHYLARITQEKGG